MKKRLVPILMMAMCAGVLFGCQKKEEEVPEVPEEAVISDVKEEEPPVVEEDTHEGQMQSYLTGEWIDEELATKRPLAIMVGNTNETGVLPQHGVCSADIIYEAPVEGEATRLMLLMQDYGSVEMVEPVRSCRLYFLEYASEFEAIYAHWGQAIYATEAVQAYDDMDGMANDVFGTAFFRDSSKKAPHNGYATGEGLVKGVELKGYETECSESYTGHYQFAQDDAEITLTGDDAVVVQPGYLLNKPWFVYHEDDGLYYRFEYKDAHTDAVDGSQLAVKNILMQYSECRSLDEHDYLEIPTAGEGEGLYITNGKAVPVTWKKDTTNSVTHYYDASGAEITLNQGKTWVCIIKNKNKDKVTLYASEADFEAGNAQ